MTMSTSAAAAASALAVASASSVSWTTSSAPAEVSAAQPARIAAGADHAPGAEPLGHLHGHRPGVAGRAEDEDALPGVDRNAAAQGDPRRHRRVHRGGDLRDVGVVGQLDRPARADERLVRHRADHVVRGHEVDPRAVGSPADPVDPGDHRQRAAARVVGSGGAAADPRVQADGEHVDEELVRRVRLRNLERLVVRRLLERCHDSRVHPGHDGVPPMPGLCLACPGI